LDLQSQLAARAMRIDHDGPIHVPDPSRVTFLRALQRSLGRTPLWIAVACFTSLLALGAALPWASWFHGAISNRYLPGSLLSSLDETFWFDQRRTRIALEEATGSVGAVLACLAVLMGAFAAGGWLQVFLQRTEGHSLRRFFLGGSRYFFRFLRVLFLTLVFLQLAAFLLYGAPWKWLVLDLGLGVSDLQELDSELTARQIGWLQDGLFLIATALIFCWGDYTRTRLALHDGVSALWAGLCTWFTIFAHPLRTLRPMLLLWLCEAALLWCVLQATQATDSRIDAPGDWLPVLLLLLLGLFAIAWRSIVRGARYAAALEVSGELVRAPRRPDPWRETIGGPGGPQYPIGGDEYGVSL
jgi:hypothetical protein